MLHKRRAIRKKEFVGGCDIVKEMYASGELAKHFEDNQISYKK